MNYLNEAFKRLEILDENTFSTDTKGLDELRNFFDSEEVSDDVIVVDPEAETDEDIKDSYVGKIILDCCVCHSMSYKDKEDVVIDEEEGLANVGEECPFCFSNDGFYVIGEVAPFDEGKAVEEDEEEIKISDDGFEVKENEEEKFESFNSRVRRQRIKESINCIQKKSVKESKETGEDLSEYQKWVDYDMKKYRKISDDTMKKIKSAGLSVVKDQYGDYEVIADRPVKEACKKSRRNKKSVDESVEVKAIDENDVEVVKNDDGSLDVKVGSTEAVDEGETIVPLDDETKIEIEDNSVEDEETGEDEMIDFDVDEFSEEDFDELGESYLKKIYNNVESYKTVKASSDNSKLYLEGVITFKSGNKKKTNFIFEALEATNSKKAKFIGENTQISKNKKAFTISGKFNEGKFIAESLNYNYRAKDAATGKSKRIYGTVKK